MLLGKKGIDFKFNTFPKFFKISIIVIVFLLLVNLFPVKILLAIDYKTNEYVKSWRIKDDESFTIEYTHSVQLTTVSETYIIDEDKIILIESHFKSYGAGLPATTPYKFEITDKGFRIYEINEIMEYLIYRTGAEVANHKLILRDKEYNFLDFTEPRAGLEFKVKKIGILLYMAKEVL